MATQGGQVPELGIGHGSSLTQPLLATIDLIGNYRFSR
jgi:hypothetical protein